MAKAFLDKPQAARVSALAERVVEQVDEMSIRLCQSLTQRSTGHGASHVVPLQAQRPAGPAAARPGMAQGGAQ